MHRWISFNNMWLSVLQRWHCLLTVLGRVTAKSNDDGVTKCRRTWTSCVTWFQHAAHWHASPTSWQFSAWPSPTWKLCGVCLTNAYSLVYSLLISICVSFVSRWVFNVPLDTHWDESVWTLSCTSTDNLVTFNTTNSCCVLQIEMHKFSGPRPSW